MMLAGMNIVLRLSAGFSRITERWVLTLIRFGVGWGWFPLHSYNIPEWRAFCKRWCATCSTGFLFRSGFRCTREEERREWVNLRGNSLSSTLLIYTSVERLDRV
jgi:hypothetical protein